MKNNNPLKSLATILLVVILGCGLSWAVIVGIIKLITVCFGLAFSLAKATSIWIMLISIGIASTYIRKVRKG